MKKISALILLVLCCFAANAQLNYRWTTVSMDSSWDKMDDLSATELISKYSPLIEPLMEIIGYSEDDYSKTRPDSGLSNFAADVVRETACTVSGAHIDVGLVNFGGIRTDLPKGAVRVYDIYSIFPFNNYLVYFDIKGSDLKKFFEEQASRRVEALSGVKFEIKGRKIHSLLVGGEPLDESKMYKFATINFLLEGGDGIQLINMAQNLVITDILMRDMIIDYIRRMTAEGRKLDLHPDGRTVIL